MTPEERKEFDSLKKDVESNWHRQCDLSRRAWNTSDSLMGVQVALGFMAAAVLFLGGAVFVLWRAL